LTLNSISQCLQALIIFYLYGDGLGDGLGGGLEWISQFAPFLIH